MTKRDLIKALEEYNDDDVVIIGCSKSGWSNIEELKQDGSCISIMEDKYYGIFTSDKE